MNNLEVDKVRRYMTVFKFRMTRIGGGLRFATASTAKHVHYLVVCAEVIIF